LAYVEDTIAAIATAAGPGAVAIVRLSGTLSFALARRVCAGPDGRAPDLSISHRARLGRVRDEAGQVLDEVLLLPMKGPRSYTGEDVVEIHCHGGDLVPRLVLSRLLREGAREARPGEFTRRAFLNGRMDLCRAEAVADLVGATSEPALQLARGQAEGRLSEALSTLRDRLVDARALVEAHLDFPEDDLPAEASLEIRDAIEDSRARIDDLLAGFDRARLVREGARVVLVGKPNVGKSSLLNALLGRDRALVSEQPGTTRDFLEEPVALGSRGARAIVVDTAGLREAEGAVERAGIERTRRLAEEGDAVLVLFDASRPPDDEDRAVLDLARGLEARGVPCVLAWNKIDLDPPTTPDARAAEDTLGANGLAVARVSARTGSGLAELCSLLDDALAALGGRNSDAAMPLVSRERHRSSLRRAAEILSGISPDDELEIVAQALQAAALELEALLGESTSEEVLDRIFEKFCIGK